MTFTNSKHCIVIIEYVSVLFDISSNKVLLIPSELPVFDTDCQHFSIDKPTPHNMLFTPTQGFPLCVAIL